MNGDNANNPQKWEKEQEWLYRDLDKVRRGTKLLETADTCTFHFERKEASLAIAGEFEERKLKEKRKLQLKMRFKPTSMGWKIGKSCLICVMWNTGSI